MRPSWWAGSSAYQPLRIADTEADLTNNVTANITYLNQESYSGDSYYAPSGGFTEYSTDGVVYYDVPIATITGKYFDLARLSSTEISTATVWNRTGTELFNVNLLNQVWRIWDDGNGIYRPSGSSAESRNVSNAVINSLLYGYMTCSTSSINGFNAYAQLNDHFNLSGRTYLETDTVLDFTSELDYSTGRGTGATVLTSDKVAMMAYKYSIANPPAGLPLVTLDYKKNTAIITLVGTLSLSALAGFYFLKTKKQ